MEKITKEGKDFDVVLQQILDENNLEKENVIYTSSQKKGKLFQGNLIEVNVFTKDAIHEEIKTYLKDVITNMGLEVQFEVLKNNGVTVIKMYSDNNSILIGRNGQTIKALETLVKQMLQVKYDILYRVSLDVENYRSKKDKNIERMAFRMAKDVVRTKMPIELDNMSSYERRVVHNALTNFAGVKTESEGEEPNRHVIIKPE